MKGMIWRMKKFTKIFYFNVVLILLVGMLIGCSDNKNEASKTGSSEDNSLGSTEENTSETDESISTSKLEETDTPEISSGESVNNDSNSNSSSENSSSYSNDKKDKETLAQYSSKQIEYARIWLQLGANQDIDGLYVQHIPAGTPLNPDDETSASYPEDVIQLAGARLVDGSVTYSGNGDGTINVYNIPLRWDGKYPAGEKFYIEIIENTKIVSIDTGDDEKIIALIKLLTVHHNNHLKRLREIN